MHGVTMKIKKKLVYIYLLRVISVALEHPVLKVRGITNTTFGQYRTASFHCFFYLSLSSNK